MWLSCTLAAATKRRASPVARPAQGAFAEAGIPASRLGLVAIRIDPHKKPVNSSAIVLSHF